MVTLLVGCVFVLSASGCSTSPPEPNPTDIDSLQPSMPPWADDVPATAGQELDDSEVPALISMPWKLAAIADDRRTITVAFFAGDGDCITHAGYSLSQVEDTITLGEFSRTSGGPACAGSGQVGVETVTLPVELDGSVTLVHQLVSGEYTNPNLMG